MKIVVTEIHMNAAIMLQRAMVGPEAFSMCCAKDLFGCDLRMPMQVCALNPFVALVRSDMYFKVLRVCRGIGLEAGC